MYIRISAALMGIGLLISASGLSAFIALFTGNRETIKYVQEIFHRLTAHYFPEQEPVGILISWLLIMLGSTMMLMGWRAWPKTCARES